MVEENKDLQQKFPELVGSYEKEREQITHNLEVCEPLYNADFCHDIHEEDHAIFKRDYIDKLRCVVDGDLKKFLGAITKDLFSDHANAFDVYMNVTTVDYIIEELEHYREIGEWNDCSKQ